jgi:hypothetical protein
MSIFNGTRWALLAAGMTALAAGDAATAAKAAPIAVMPENVIAAQSNITDVRYRRHYGGGGTFAGVALGILALGAAAALANQNDYYDYPYYDGGYGGGYYPAYPYGGYRVYRPSYYGYYGYPRHPYYRHYGYGWRHENGWHRSDRVGRN